MQEAISFQHEEKIPLKWFLKNIANEHQLYLPLDQSVQFRLKLKDYDILPKSICCSKILKKHPDEISYQCACGNITKTIGNSVMSIPIMPFNTLHFRPLKRLKKKRKARYNKINKELDLVQNILNILNSLKDNLDLINLKSNKRKSHCRNIEKKVLDENKFPTTLFLYEICTKKQYHDIADQINKYFNLKLNPDKDQEKVFIYFAFWKIIQNVLSYKNLLKQAIGCIKSNILNIHFNVMFNDTINGRIKLFEDNERIEYHILDYYINAVDNKTKHYSNTYVVCFEKATKKWNIYPGFPNILEEIDIEQFKTNFRKKLEHNQLLQDNGF